jgi:hypothetical protein
MPYFVSCCVSVFVFYFRLQEDKMLHEVLLALVGYSDSFLTQVYLITETFLETACLLPPFVTPPFSAVQTTHSPSYPSITP